jgi:hypothetical protein
VNHTCNGTWFPALDLYRCLGNGKFVAMREQPGICPACGRKAHPQVQSETAVRSSVVEQVKWGDQWVEASRTDGPEREIHFS